MIKAIHTQDKNSIPVLCHTDLLVVGGSLSGLAAATAYAESGKTAMVIDRRTFVGYELTYWQRAWVTWRGQEAELIGQWLGIHGNYVEGEHIPLHMNDLKVALEDRLFASGVKLLYLSQPVAVQVTRSGFEVIIANKSGRQAIRCKSIFDATEEGIMQRLMACDASAFARRKADTSIRVRRVIDFMDVDESWKDVYDIPVSLGVAGDQIKVRQGGYNRRHVFVDIPLDLPYTAIPTLQADMQLDFISRKKSFEVACWLHQNIEAFREALFVSGSCGVMKGNHFDSVAALHFGAGLCFADGQCVAQKDEQLECCKYEAVDDELVYREQSEFKRHSGISERSTWITKSLPVLANCDVAVAGGGVAGAVAGFAAGREGARTVVAEMHHALGGTGTIGAVNMYWLSNDNACSTEIDTMVLAESARVGLPRQYSISGRGPEEGNAGAFSTYSQDFIWNVEIKENVLLELCRQAGVEVYLNCLLCGTLMKDNAVKGLILATPYGPAAILAKGIVDATGDGDAAAFSGGKFVYGNDRDRIPMWSAMSPMSSPGRYKSNFHALVDIGDVMDYTRFILATRRRDEGARIYDHASYVAPRESRHIEGDVTITLTDQLRLKQYADTVSVAFSNFDCQGHATADILYLGVNPPNYDLEIPFRACLPKGLENLVVTGRAFSCTHDALAAPRMQKDVQQYGYAAGVAAALAVREGLSPRQLPCKKLQMRLVEAGNLSPDILYRIRKDSHWDIQELINGITGEEPIDWLTLDSSTRFTEMPVFLKLCFSKIEDVVPVLLHAFRRTGGPKRLLLARLLMWHRCKDDELLSFILSEIDQELSCPNLPRRTGDIYFIVYAPGQAIMPEILYLVNMLYRIGDERVLPVYEAIVERLEKMHRDYKDRRAGIFDYMESVAYAAERMCLEGFKPLLMRLMTLPELQNIVLQEGCEPDFMRDRMVYLSIILARALARCGCKSGLAALLTLAGDNRAVYAKTAIDELTVITGGSCYDDLRAWHLLIESMPENYAPVPWTTECE